MQPKKGRRPAPADRAADLQTKSKFLYGFDFYHSRTPPSTQSLPQAGLLGLPRNRQIGGGL
jgi:hypothetical protein